ncbi:MAG TPA: lysylphosphatidylglycerol synthase transmembrane domain-containing protein [Myxococcota bacterium]|nr:lysylphosphatidylglycerol synthase transmembrane domain-containing protein [Myxococcota bacterium]
MWDKDELTRRRLLLAVRVAVSAGAIAWVATRVDPADALGAFRRAPAWVFAVPPVLMLANSTLHALRLKLLLEALDARIPLRKALAALLKASFLGLVLPSGGSDVAKAGFLGEEAGLDKAAVALTASRLQDLLPWAGLLLYGLGWGLLDYDPALALAAAVFATAFLLIPAAAWFLAARPIRAPFRWLEGPVDAVRTLRTKRRTLALTAALAIPFAFVNAGCAWIVIEAHGVDMALADALALIPAADTLISLPITISGVGVREGVFVRVLGPYGALEATAVAIGLTRWLGELARAAIGGLLFVAGRG